MTPDAANLSDATAALEPPPPPPPPPPEELAGAFGLFSAGHLLTVAACCAVIAALLLLGRRWRGTSRERRLRLAWACPIFATQAAGIVYWLLPPNFEWGVSLPLQMCDVSAVLAPFALLTQNRPCRAVLFFWGLVMSWIAFVIPALERGPGEFAFWLFWVGHTQILGSALYDVAVLGYRPTWRDYRWMLLPNLIGLAIVVPLNFLAGTNYWYIGDVVTPGSPAPLFGPWPLRIVPMVLLVLGVHAAVVAAFRLAARLGRRPHGTEPTAAPGYTRPR